MGMQYSATMSPICPSKCFGHFDESPCLPVAFLVSHLIDTAMQSAYLLNKASGIGSKPLVAKSGFLDATTLVKAGTYGLHIEGMTRKVEGGVYEFSIDVFAKDNEGNGMNSRGDKIA